MQHLTAAETRAYEAAMAAAGTEAAEDAIIWKYAQINAKREAAKPCEIQAMWVKYVAESRARPY